MTIDGIGANEDESYHEEGNESEYHSDEDGMSFRSRPRRQKPKRKQRASSPDPLAQTDPVAITPRTQHLIDIINTRDVSQIKSLNGLGAKRAEGIVEYLNSQLEAEGDAEIRCWHDLSRLKGVGKKTLESMRRVFLSDFDGRVSFWSGYSQRSSLPSLLLVLFKPVNRTLRTV